MTESKIINGAGWHKPPPPPKPPREPKPPKPSKPPREQKQKPISKLDVKFEEWAKRNNINLRDLKIMEKNK